MLMHGAGAAAGQTALDELWPYTGELFAADEVDRLLAGAGAPEPAALEAPWREVVSDNHCHQPFEEFKAI